MKHTNSKRRRRVVLTYRDLTDDMSKAREERAWDALAMLWHARVELLAALDSFDSPGEAEDYED